MYMSHIHLSREWEGVRWLHCPFKHLHQRGVSTLVLVEGQLLQEGVAELEPHRGFALLRFRAREGASYGRDDYLMTGLEDLFLPHLENAATRDDTSLGRSKTCE